MLSVLWDVLGVCVCVCAGCVRALAAPPARPPTHPPAHPLLQEVSGAPIPTVRKAALNEWLATATGGVMAEQKRAAGEAKARAIAAARDAGREGERGRGWWWGGVWFVCGGG